MSTTERENDCCKQNHIICDSKQKNINLLGPDQKHNRYFSVLKDTYDLTNLIQVPTCFKELF